MSHSEAIKIFSVGMSPDEVRHHFGEPTDSEIINEIETWYYSLPENHLNKMKPGDEWEGFMIDFEHSTTIRIRRILTVVS